MNSSTRTQASCIALAAIFFLFSGLSVREADAQIAMGAQASFGSESDLGVGARLLANLGGSNFEFVASVDRFFPDNEIDWWDLNANLFYHFHMPETPSVLPYLGGGVNQSRRSSNSFERNETGINVGGGLRFPGNITPFVELRAVISDVDQIVLTGGILFGPTRGR